MIPNAANYDFVSVSTPGCVAGGAFGAAISPRLEDLVWMAEAARTAEHRGGLDVWDLSYPAVGQKEDPAEMCPDLGKFSSLVTRINSVLTVSYHDFQRLPSGVWGQFSTTLWYPRGIGQTPLFMTSEDLANACAGAVTTPAGVSLTASISPTSLQTGELADAAWRATMGTIVRSSVFRGQRDSLYYLIYCGARTDCKNGSAGNTPTQDWSFGYIENPLFDETNALEPPHSNPPLDYYRHNASNGDFAYSREASDWNIPMGLPRWTYCGGGSLQRTSLNVMLVWVVYAAPLWRYLDSTGRYVRDKTVSRFVWSGAPNSTWHGIYAFRDPLVSHFEFPAGATSSIIKSYGDHICNQLPLSTLPSSGVMGESTNVTRDGYCARIECIGAIFVVNTAMRDIGS